MLQDLGFLVQKQLQSKLLLLIAELGGALDLFGLIEAPSIELVAENLEVLCLLGVHAALDFFFVLDLLLVSEVGLLGLQFVVLICTLLTQTVGCATGEPSTDVALDLQSDCFSLLVPHGRGHILPWIDDLIVSRVDVKTRLLHLDSELTHHLRRLGLVLIRLHLSLDLLRMVVLCLISLREGVMVRDASPVVAEASEVWFLFLLLLNGNSHDFHLVVSQTDLDLELVWHHELVSLDRVVVVGWLLSDLITFLAHHVLVVHRLSSINKVTALSI